MINRNSKYISKKYRILKFSGVIKSLLIFLTIILLYPENIVKAQSQWLDYGKGNSVSLEIYKPFIPRDSFPTSGGRITPGFTAGSMAFFLSGRYVISKAFTITADIPFTTGGYDDTLGSPDETGFKFGNLYIGAEYYLPESPVKVELGFRIPLSAKDKIQSSIVGVRSDIDRTEAFLTDIVPVYAAINFKTVSESKILFNARLGGNIWFNSKKFGLYSQPVFSTAYTLQTGYMHEDVNFLVGLSGRYNTDSGPQYPEKINFIQYGMLVTFPIKNVRPALSIKVPGDDLDEFLNYVFGLNFTYGFK